MNKNGTTTHNIMAVKKTSSLKSVLKKSPTVVRKESPVLLIKK